MSPERVVRVRLSATVAEYKKSMEEAAQKTRELGTEGEKLAQTKAAFNALGAAGLAMGGLITAGVGLAVKRFADFDQAMSAVSAATHGSADEMGQLRDAAIEAGASTVFSATEAANAIEELAKAGVSTTDILHGGLKGALDLASAGGLGVADAAGIASTALTQFGLKGADMAHVADLLAAGAGKAMGDVTDLSAALNQTGLVAASTGLSIDETTAGLAAFASQGLLGSDAGTSFKTMLQRLTPQSAEAQKMMDQLGLSAYDASGQFVGLSAYAGNLQSAMKALTPEQRNAALSVMFGSDAVRAATVLYQEGSKGIDDWTKAVADQGYAADTARRRLDNLKGDLEALGGAFDTALIETGSHANDTLRTMVQALTGLVSMYGDLPAPVQAFTTVVGGATAAVFLSGGAAFTAIPKWLEFKETVKNSSLSLRGVGMSAGAAGLALGALFLVVGELAAKQQRARELAQSYADTIAEGATKVGDATRKITVDELKKGGDWLSFNWQSAYDAADKLGVSLDTVTDAAMGNQDAMGKLKPYYDALSGDTAKFYDIASKTGMSAAETRLALEAMTNGIGSQNEAIKRGVELKGQEKAANADVTDATKSAGESYLDEAKKVDELNSQLTQLIGKINEANGVNQDAISANARYQDALAGISREVQQQRDEYERTNETLDGFSLSLDQNTASGSANAAMLADVAGAAQTAASKQYEVDVAAQGGEVAARNYAATLADQRQKFVDSATAAGFNADEVQKLADKVFSLPPSKSVDVLANTGPAQSSIDQFITLNDGKRVRVFVDAEGGQSFKVGSTTVSAQANGGVFNGGVKAFANSGFEPGIYPYTPGGIHKFAEQWSEAYISGDPARRARSEQVWVESGRQFGFSDPSRGSHSGQSETPTVQVFIGDEEITGRVRVVVNDAIATYDTQLSRGVGRRR
ncbi:phage tail tape measure protein [Microbacterium azadirachtae]|uniref:Phage-related minor tail protein n=1 Tax=Microbacterium azadirachtae TaxID=582680 RepID=A0A0F0LT83_9MICO|nr:phage tail tape measure protein [Microbacterium azadirachtae]KJL35470.1 Phage-related minor tail protein [Microbacterium azadirachtae]